MGSLTRTITMWTLVTVTLFVLLAITGDSSPQIQNCVGSQCNQNNIGGGFTNKFRPFQRIRQFCVGGLCNQNNVRGSAGGSGTFRANGQFCVGSQCRQNSDRGLVTASGAGFGRFRGNRQFCVGGQCSRNYFKKRALPDESPLIQNLPLSQRQLQNEESTSFAKSDV